MKNSVSHGERLLEHRARPARPDASQWLPLTQTQLGIWLAQMLDPQDPRYNVGEYLEIQGDLDPVRFESALRAVVAATDTLHLRVVQTGDGVRQRVVPVENWTFNVLDLRREERPLDAARSHMALQMARPMAMDQGPLFGFSLYLIAPRHFIWHHYYHHICSDGITTMLMARRVAEHYTCLMRDTPAPPCRWGAVADLITNETQYLASHQHLLDGAFWQQQLANRPRPVTLSGKPATRGTGFLRNTRFLSRTQFDQVRGEAKIAPVMLAAAAFYLHRITHTDDLLIGMTFARRPDPQIRGVGGMMSGVLPLRFRIQTQAPFSDLVAQAQTQIRQAAKHQRYAEMEIRRDLGLEPDEETIYGLVLNVMPFDYQLQFDHCAVRAQNIGNWFVDDLEFAVYERGVDQEICVEAIAQPEHYTLNQCQAHHLRFLNLFKILAQSDPDQPLRALDLMDHAERHHLLHHLNQTDAPYPRTQTLHALFEARAAQHPQHTALLFEHPSAGTQRLTYAQLDQKANQLAHVIQTQLAACRQPRRPDTLIALLLDRDLDMVVSILAVLKAGAAYVPIAPHHPASRTRFVLTDTGAPLLLTQRRHVATLGASLRDVPSPPAVLAVDENALITKAPIHPPAAVSSAHHPVYVMYTSGTTGRPKGVVVTHQSVVNLIQSQRRTYQFGDDERVLWLASYFFDASVESLFMTLTGGGALLVAADETVRSPDAVVAQARHHKVTHLDVTPSYLAVFKDRLKTPFLRRVICGGEPLSSTVRDRWGGLLFNAYGPTEAAVTCFTGTPPHGDRPLNDIGGPVGNTRFYLLDPSGALVPAGAPGQLHVGGACLARGYLGRPGLTAARFTPNPFATREDLEMGYTRLYQTGDMARILDDGRLEFLGRADAQVKIRGFRVELGEIESVLNTHPAVKQAVVIDLDHLGQKRLAAYLIGRDGVDLDKDALRAHLARSLPDYMIPAAFTVIPTLPLTANDKLDRNALPQPQWRDDAPVTAPRNPLEAQLRDIWQDLLGQDVGIHDSFFHLGGDSIAALKLTQICSRKLNLDLPLVLLFQEKTIANLATKLKQAQRVHIPALALELYPVSFAQERLLFLERFQKTAAYYIPQWVRLTPALDLPALEAAFKLVVQRHPVIHSLIFTDDEGRSYLRPMAGPFQFQTHHVGDDAVTAARALLQQPFDPSVHPGLQCHRFLSPSHDHLLLLWHHSAFDGWSAQRFMHELDTAYAAYRTHNAPKLPPLELTYGDVALWQRDRLQGEVLTALEDFWRRELTGFQHLELMGDHPRPARVDGVGADHCFRLGRDTADALRALAQTHNTTLFTVLLSGYMVTLAGLSGQTDLILGFPSDNRQHPQTQALIGFFVNLLPLRIRLDPHQTVAAWMDQVHHAVVRAKAHQELPFDQMLKLVNLTHDPSRHPLVQVIFALEKEAPAPQHLPFAQADPALEYSPAKFDLGLTLVETDDLTGIFNGAVSLFDKSTLARFADLYQRVLQGFIQNPDRAVGRLDLLSARERDLQAAAWNRVGLHTVPRPDGTTIARVFEDRVDETPDAVALVQGEQVLTYALLNSYANRLAHELRIKGVTTDTLVGVAMDRSIAMVVTLLGILKAGGAYVPIDPQLPEERRAVLLTESKPHLLVTTAAHAPLFLSFPQMVIKFDEQAHMGHFIPNLDNIASADSLAYVNHTSGSQGRPKGVLVPHAGVLRLVLRPNFAQLNADTCLLQLAPISFDAATFEIWGALLNGGRLVLMPQGPVTLDGIAEVLTRHPINTLWLTSGLFSQVVDHVLPALAGVTQLLAGGDVLSAPHLKRVQAAYPNLALINGYGPTENTTFTCCHRLVPTEDPARYVPIGLPVNGTRVAVLNACLEPVPLGTPGQLFASGAGLARGYLGRPDLTALCFIPNPFGANGERMYATGDRVHALPDGRLVFLGRVDRQFKLRGYRIEPGEIERTLGDHEAVAEALVLIQEVDQDKQLLAYVRVAESDDATHAALGRELRDLAALKLPKYMVPNHIIPVTAWPLNANGKIDRVALPRPEGRPAASSSRAPRSPEEELLCAAFAQVLALDGVGIDDDFFQLGGHSLLATRIVSRIRAELKIELPIRDLFESPTPAALAARLRDHDPSAAPLQKQPRPEHPPLSFGQQRLWFLDQVGAGRSQYNLPLAWRLRGELDRDALSRALTTIAARHESLRTCFPTVNGTPWQAVAPATNLSLPVTDLTQMDAAMQQQTVQVALDREQDQPFALDRGPLWRRHLFQLGRRHHVLLITFHHIITDGWSMGVFHAELQCLYRAFVQGRDNPLPVPAFQFVDYALWEHQRLAQTFETDMVYWRKQLAGIPECLSLATDRPRPPIQTFTAGTLRTTLSAGEVTPLQQLAHTRGATLYMTLLAAYALLLKRHSGSHDMVIGSPIANRRDAHWEGMIGFFVNTLVMRTPITPVDSFNHFLGCVRQTTLAAYQHQSMPFEKLVEALAPRRDLNHTPLFQVVFALQNAPMTLDGLEGLELTPLQDGKVKVSCDLELHAAQNNGGLDLWWVYNSDLFDADRIQRMARHFHNLLIGLPQSADRPICRLEMLDPEERRVLLRDLNQTRVALPRLNLTQLFEQHAAANPPAVALQMGEDTLSYGELNVRANALAHALRQHGVGPEHLVGLCLNRSFDMITALLAVLKSGAAYVPLDPDYPAARIALILDDANPTLVLTQTANVPRLPKAARLLVLDDPGRRGWEDVGEEACLPAPRLEHVAYVIYTSGTTGKPKGVMVTHRGMTNLALHQIKRLGINADSRILQFATLNFDASVIEWVMAFGAGARLVLMDALMRGGPALEAVLINQKITHTLLLPIALASLDKDKDYALQALLVGAEACPGDLVADWSSRRPMFNAYGPTEATVVSTMSDRLSGNADPPIGKPLSNTTVYVLDEHLEPQPMGVAGELYVAGIGLGRGYLHLRGLTAERFVPNPFSEEPGARMYRTGDRVRWNTDHNLDFLGRVDQQVKIRGHRIEPREVELALAQHPHLDRVLVVVDDDPTVGGRALRLVAYVQTGAVEPSSTQLRQFLEDRLPSYMTPAVFHPLKAFPEDANGKIDRRALPKPAAANWDTPFKPPETLLERDLAAVWAEVLNLPAVGIHDNFFDLGGHSLALMRVHHLIKSRLHFEAAMLELLQYPTIASLARAVGERSQPEKAGAAVPSKPAPQTTGRDRGDRRRRAMNQSRKTRNHR